MTQDELKQAVARAARDYVADRLPVGAIVGVGTGSTANFFIDALGAMRDRIAGASPVPRRSAARLCALGIRCSISTTSPTCPSTWTARTRSRRSSP
jgi:ribose 5-phosphate isomerase A